MQTCSSAKYASHLLPTTFPQVKQRIGIIILRSICCLILQFIVETIILIFEHNYGTGHFLDIERFATATRALYIRVVEYETFFELIRTEKRIKLREMALKFTCSPFLSRAVSFVLSYQ